MRIASRGSSVRPIRVMITGSQFLPRLSKHKGSENVTLQIYIGLEDQH